MQAHDHHHHHHHLDNENEDEDEEKSADDCPRVSVKRPIRRAQYHPWQRRKLRVPNDGGDVEVGEEERSHFMDAYEHQRYGGANSDFFWQEDLIAPLPHYHGRPRRPWPSSQVLSSTMIATNNDTDNRETVGMAAHNNNKLVPFLEAFYKSVGMAMPSSSSEVEDPREKLSVEEEELSLLSAEQQAGKSELEDLDNSAFSTLIPSQHRRYLKLLEQTERRTPSERAHWKQLRGIVPVEQAKYQKAVQQFWSNHRDDRLLLGLSSSSSSSSSLSSGLLGDCYQWACAENRRRNERLLGRRSLLQEEDGFTAPVFGKCRQVLSLRPSLAAAVTKDKHHDTSLPDVISFDIKVVSSINDVDDGTTNHHHPAPPIISELPAVGTRIQAPSSAATSSSFLETRLQDDTKALQLAAQYKAEIMTTDETLETLLCIPGDRTTRWMLLATTCSSSTSTSTDNNNNNKRQQQGQVIVLESPLAQAYTTPRECLTRGIQEGLYQQAAAAASTRTNQSRKTNDPASPNLQQHHQQYAYTLWTLPATTCSGAAARRSQKSASCKVLIRSIVRLQWITTTDPPGMTSGAARATAVVPAPLKIRAHIEYFPERGQELLSRYERSLWILDQLLWQGGVVPNNPKIVTRLCRVDGRNGTVLEWQETSVAHAFAVEGEGGESPMQGFAQLIQFFQAVSTIDLPKGTIIGGRGGGTSTTTVDSELRRQTTTTTTTTTTPPFQTPNCRLLCLPSREATSSSGSRQQQASEGYGNATAPFVISDPYSVSVHAPCLSTTPNIHSSDKQRRNITTTTTRHHHHHQQHDVVVTTSDAFVVDLEPVLQNADGVLLNAKAIQECQRPWKWDIPDRIPYTFPTTKTITTTTTGRNNNNNKAITARTGRYSKNKR